VFRNCYFSVGKGSKKKDILKGISGEVHSGHVLAVMGEICPALYSLFMDALYS